MNRYVSDLTAEASGDTTRTRYSSHRGEDSRIASAPVQPVVTIEPQLLDPYLGVAASYPNLMPMSLSTDQALLSLAAARGSVLPRLFPVMSSVYGQPAVLGVPSS